MLLIIVDIFCQFKTMGAVFSRILCLYNNLIKKIKFNIKYYTEYYTEYFYKLKLNFWPFLLFLGCYFPFWILRHIWVYISTKIERAPLIIFNYTKGKINNISNSIYIYNSVYNNIFNNIFLKEIKLKTKTIENKLVYFFFKFNWKVSLKWNPIFKKNSYIAYYFSNLKKWHKS